MFPLTFVPPVAHGFEGAWALVETSTLSIDCLKVIDHSFWAAVRRKFDRLPSSIKSKLIRSDYVEVKGPGKMSITMCFTVPIEMRQGTRCNGVGRGEVFCIGVTSL